MGAKLKFAILGGGRILSAHAPAFARLGDICEVVAVAEKDAAQHERIKNLLQKDVPIYEDYEQALEIPGLDAVDILLPHSMHRDAAINAAAKNLHVLCEKVMARNVYECAEMIEACEKAGVELVITHDRRYAGDWVKLKEIIDSGALGDILFIKMEHNQNVVMPENTWPRWKDGIGGGAIMSCLTHQIDALRWYAGEVKSVNCMSKIVPSRMEGECIGAVTAQMECGALALLSINWHTQSFGWDQPPNSLWYEFNHVCGTRGEAYFMHGKGTYVKQYAGFEKSVDYDSDNTGGFIRLDSAQESGGHQKCIEEFINKINGRPANILTPGSDTIKTVEVAEAAYLSEAQGKVVELPVMPAPWNERKY